MSAKGRERRQDASPPPAVIASPRSRTTLMDVELIGLTAFALLTRFWNLFSPRVVIWDEIHFIRYTASYFTGKYYVDVHPPLAKLLFYATARLTGMSGAALAADQPAPMLRILPALAGALIIPVVYLIARELGGSRRVATFAAAILLVDNALLAISRIIVMDSMLVFFGMTAVLCFLAARRHTDGRRWALLAACAIAAGMSAGTKWTGLAALGLILATWALDVVIEKRRDLTVLGEGLLLLVVPAIVYSIPFAIHFALLNRDGPGAAFMSYDFRKTLLGNHDYVAGARIGFLQAFSELHSAMLGINLGWATDTNASASPWYTWPISKHNIGFWMDNRDPSAIRWIMMFGNPVTWWAILAAMASLVLAWGTRNAELARHRRALLFLGAGYVMNFLPFAFIHRPMYLYHYLFALAYGALLAAFVIGALAGWMESAGARPWTFTTPRSRGLYIGVLGLATIVFLYLTPLTYGRPLSWAANRRRMFVLARRMSVLRDTVPPPLVTNSALGK